MRLKSPATGLFEHWNQATCTEMTLAPDFEIAVLAGPWVVAEKLAICVPVAHLNLVTFSGHGLLWLAFGFSICSWYCLLL